MPVKLAVPAREEKPSLRSSLSKDFVLGEVLGRSSTCIVMRAEKRGTHEEVALKMGVNNDERMDDFLAAEFKVLQRIRHPRIVRAIDHVCYDAGSALVLELVGGQSLKELVRQRGPLPEDSARQVFAALLQAVRDLHDLGVCHRDIKPDNVMVSQDLQDVKIIDFNTACLLEDGSLTPAGDRRSAPPEVLLGDSPLEGADVWGAGLCYYFMLTGCLPQGRDKCSLDATALGKAAQKPVNFSGPLWANVTERSKAFLGLCLALNPDDRPSAEGLFRIYSLTWSSSTSLMESKGKPAARTNEKAAFQDGLQSLLDIDLLQPAVC